MELRLRCLSRYWLLNPFGVNDNVRKVVTSLMVENSPARHQLQRGVVARTVDQGTRKVRLRVHVDTDHLEGDCPMVSQVHDYVVAYLQPIDIEEDRRPVIVVNVTEDHSRTGLSWRLPVFVPARNSEVRGHLNGAIRIETQFTDRRRY